MRIVIMADPEKESKTKRSPGGMVTGILAKDGNLGIILELTLYIPRQVIRQHSRIDADASLKANITRFLNHMKFETERNSPVSLKPEEITARWLEEKRIAHRAQKRQIHANENVENLQKWINERVLEDREIPNLQAIQPDQETVHNWATAGKLWTYDVQMAEQADAARFSGNDHRTEDWLRERKKEKLLERHVLAEPDNAQARYFESGLKEVTRKILVHMTSIGCPVSSYVHSESDEYPDVDKITLGLRVRDASLQTLCLADAMNKYGESFLQNESVKDVAAEARIEAPKASQEDYTSFLGKLHKVIFDSPHANNLLQPGR